MHDELTVPKRHEHTIGAIEYALTRKFWSMAERISDAAVGELGVMTQRETE
jgi:hypothetical protein